MKFAEKYRCNKLIVTGEKNGHGSTLISVLWMKMRKLKLNKVLYLFNLFKCDVGVAQVTAV